jgi:hypothetical protein
MSRHGYFPKLGSKRIPCASASNGAAPVAALPIRSKVKSPMQGDPQTAYLFQCDGEELFAVSPDKAGANIPRSSCTQGWLLQQEFQLATQDPVPGLIAPEPIIRSINDKGYYIWRDACWAQRRTHWLAATTLSPIASQMQQQQSSLHPRRNETDPRPG